jgi:hypothetical protein
LRAKLKPLRNELKTMVAGMDALRVVQDEIPDVELTTCGRAGELLQR